MPVAFVAHGSPLLALDPVAGAELAAWARDLPRPEAILVVSAHWSAPGPAVGSTSPAPILHDFGGFPPELYRLDYRAPPAPALADRVGALLGAARAPARGLDHGAWVPLRWMFPAADVPVLQLALPSASPERLVELGQRLRPLRSEGGLVLGSGSLTHALGRLEPAGGPPPAWALAFEAWLVEALSRRDPAALLGWRRAPHAATAHPTTEHLDPLLVALGAAGGDEPSYPVTGWEYGSLSRRCVRWG